MAYKKGTPEYKAWARRKAKDVARWKRSKANRLAGQASDKRTARDYWDLEYGAQQRGAQEELTGLRQQREAALRDIQPWQEVQAAVDARLADRGMTYGGIGQAYEQKAASDWGKRYQAVLDPYTARERAVTRSLADYRQGAGKQQRLLYGDLQRARQARDDTLRQSQRDYYLRRWQSMQANRLAEQQFDENKPEYAPERWNPEWDYGQNYGAGYYGGTYGDPVGDISPKNWNTPRKNTGKSARMKLAERQQSAAEANAAANRTIQQGYLALAQAKAKAEAQQMQNAIAAQQQAQRMQAAEKIAGILAQSTGANNQNMAALSALVAADRSLNTYLPPAWQRSLRNYGTGQGQWGSPATPAAYPQSQVPGTGAFYYDLIQNRLPDSGESQIEYDLKNAIASSAGVPAVQAVDWAKRLFRPAAGLAGGGGTW